MGNSKDGAILHTPDSVLDSEITLVLLSVEIEEFFISYHL